MVEIRKLQSGDDEICGAILRNLPQWFGIESAICGLRVSSGNLKLSTNESATSEEV